MGCNVLGLFCFKLEKGISAQDNGISQNSELYYVQSFPDVNLSPSSPQRSSQ